MIRRFLAALAISVGILAAPAPAQAAPSPLQYMGADCGSGVASFLFLKPWHACLPKDSNGVPQIRSLTDFWLIFIPLLEDALKIAGYAAAGFVLWGGIKYLKSQGDPGQLNEARQVIHNALFGLVLALLSVAIVNFIAGSIG